MTSNIGAGLIQDKMEIINEDNFDSVMDELKLSLTDLLRKKIRPEFLNRIDEVVLFKPLLKNEMKKIVDIQLGNVEKLLADKNIKMKVSESAKEFLVESGYDVSYGARPLKRTIQKYLINPLSTEILVGEFSSGDTIFVDHENEGRLSFKKSK